MRHLFTWVMIVVLLGSLAACSPAEEQPPVEELPVEEEPVEQVNLVQVSLVEYTIEMLELLPAGPAEFQVTNNGTFEHNFMIEGQGISEVFAADLQPGETGILQVDLPPGEYRVYCPVSDHAEQGMELTLIVS